MVETVALGRSKRSTAGNRMRELLEKAHQEDEDELFKEVEDDEDFAAPQDTRDVFLEDFADTDEEVEMDEEEVERQMRKEERRKAKGKGKAVYNPLAPKQTTSIPKSKPLLSTAPAQLSPSQVALLDPSIDPETMAPSTLVLALRKQRREQKRANRSENRRSNLRASTLRTEEEILEKERLSKENPNRKGRKAQHEGGEVRGVRTMTQDELIAAALEEEERNKESLRDWLRREEERRELRRVGRKRVRGARWTWVSRTVGKAVEVVEVEPEAGEANALAQISASAPGENTPAVEGIIPDNNDNKLVKPNAADSLEPIPTPALASGMGAGPSTQPTPVLPQDPNDLTFPYTRNYLILSQIPGGLPAEFSLILGDHTDWSTARHIPARNRPLVRRPPTCPFTGLPAKYRHPSTGIMYATAEGYKVIEEMLANEYVWDENAGWVGREDEWLEDIEEWAEAVSGGWMSGELIQVEEPIMEEDVEMEEEVGEGIEEEAVVQETEEVVPLKVPKRRGRKPKNASVQVAEDEPISKKGKKGKLKVTEEEVMPDGMEQESPIVVVPKGKSKKGK